MNMLSRLFKDSFIRFTLMGVILFGLSWTVQAIRASSGNEILITKAVVDQLRGYYRATNGREPSEDELNLLINDHVKDEALVREALDWGLHYNDPIVRRRLIQKVELLFSGYVGEHVKNADIVSYYENHKQQFEMPAAYGFRQVFLSFDKHGQSAKDKAITSLQKLRKGEKVEGDIWYLGSSEILQTGKQLHSLFGKTFARDIQALPVGEWAGPVESAYGYHLIFIENHKPAHIPSLQDVKQKVWIAFQRDREKQAFEKFTQNTAKKYTVTMLE